MRLKLGLKFGPVCFLAAEDHALQLLAKFLPEGAVDEQVDGRVEGHKQIGEQSLKREILINYFNIC